MVRALAHVAREEKLIKSGFLDKALYSGTLELGVWVAEDESEEPDDDEQMPEDEDGFDVSNYPDKMEETSSRERDLLQKLHENMGHPELRRFIKVLRAAGVKSRLLRWLRHKFVCPHCVEHQRPGIRRRAALPRRSQQADGQSPGVGSGLRG